MKDRLVRVGTSTVRGFLDDDVLGLSAELAFRWLLAIFPLTIMTAAMAGFSASILAIQDPTDQVLDLLGGTLPPEAAATIRPQLERVLENRDGGIFTLGLALTVYAASAGMKALIKGLNRAYDVQESRPLWRQYAVAIGLTLLAGGAVIVALLFIIGAEVTTRQVATTVAGEGSADTILDVLAIPVSLLALVVATSFLYRVAPARHPGWRWVLPGVALFVPAWLAATFGFSLYITNFGSYADTYGALAGVVILLLWFYITWTILLLGGELNVALEREFGAEPDLLPAAADGTVEDPSDPEAAHGARA